MLVANSGLGDARVMKEAESLVAAGHAVTVFCLAGPGGAGNEHQEGVCYRRLPPWHRRWTGTQDVTVSGAEPLPRRHTIISDIKGLFEPYLRHELLAATFAGPVAAAAPDLIHAHDFETLPAAVRAAARCGARVVYDMHELEEGRLPAASPLLAAWKTHLETRALMQVSATLTVSPSIARYKARKYNIPLPTVVLNAPRVPAPGTPENNGRPGLRQRCGLAAEVPLAVYTGTVSPGRGVEQLIDAFAITPAMHLAILGNVRAGLRPLLEAARERLAGRLHVLAPVPHDDVVADIASADLGVCTIPGTCLNYEYCLPNKLFELTLAGLPVLVANTTELSRFVAETGTGLTANGFDPVDIARGLDAVYAARETLRPAPEALAALRARYGWQRQADRLAEVYDAVARGPRGVPAAMAQRALATGLRPAGLAAYGG